MDPNRPDRPIDRPVDLPLGGPPAMSPPSPGEGGTGEDRPRGRWPNEPQGRYYDETRAAALKGSIRGSRLLPALLFRPTEFMLSHAVHARFSQVFVIMWLAGALAFIDRLEMQSLSGRTGGLMTIVNTWTEVWSAAIGSGLIRGMIYYWLLGLWFRARLHLCGVRRVDSGVAGRVFAFTHFPLVLVSFCYYAAASVAFDDFKAYIQTENIGWILAGMIPAATSLYATCLSYASVRGVFNARRAWAILWFLVLPLTAKAVVLSVVLLAVWFAETNPKPDTDNPKTARTATMTMQYPGNWVADIDQPETGPAKLIDLQPTGHDANIAVDILYYAPEKDPIAETEQWLAGLGYELRPDPKPLTTWGTYQGEGFEYSATNAGEEYVLRMFFSPLAHDGWLEIREIVHADSVERLEPGIEFVRRSTVIRDPATLAADVSSPKWLEAGGVRFRAPANWWNTRWIEEDPEPGRAADFRLRAESGQQSFLSILGYSNSPGPRTELSASLENLGITGRMDGERALDAWLGLEGLGVEGIDRADAEGERDRRIRLIVCERIDGTFVEVLQVEYLGTESLTAPGFALIDSSFEVDARAPATTPTEPPPEPAPSPEPTAG